MASPLLNLFSSGNDNSERITLRQENQQQSEEINYLSSEIRDIQESLLQISDAFDNVGWSPLPEDEASEISLTTVKKVAKLARAMHAMNPFIKRGIAARVGYIWGKDVTFDGVDSIADELELNRKKLFSTQAYHELERVLATDGNAFTALNVSEDDATAFRITLDEITGAVANPLDKEEIWYYKREYTVEVTNSQTGVVKRDNVIKYYASLGYYQKLEKQNKILPKRWNKIGVEQNYVIQHTTVNKQVGWRWGVPDIMPVIFWAKAYKEYLEDNAMLVKAYSRLAWQIKAPSAANAQAASTQIMRPPTRDPLTGKLNDVGGTALSGLGGELSPIAATGSQVDFDKGSALASAIASGLEVSKVVITSDPGSGNRATAETLDLPTLKAMEARQQVHTERFLEIFEFWGADVTPPRKSNPGSRQKTVDVQEAGVVVDDQTNNKAGESNPVLRASQNIQKPQGTGSGVDYAIVTWPQIETDATKDRVVAIGTAVELGVIFKQEARKELLDVFGIAPYKPWDELPTMADDPAAQEQQVINQQNAEQEFKNQQEITKQSVIAKQGQSGGVSAKGGSQSTNNQARDSRKQNTGNS